jgi:inorganic pyrophosphatase
MTDSVICMVEIPRGSRNKYEYDPHLGAIKLDRHLAGSTPYPVDYGFVPETLAPDDDPLDALVCSSEPIFPGCYLAVKIVGLLRMSDEEGDDNKLVCVPRDDPGWSHCEDLEDLPEALRQEIAHFFTVYKDLDADRFSHVTGWGDRDAGLAELADAQQRFGSHEADRA